MDVISGGDRAIYLSVQENCKWPQRVSSRQILPWHSVAFSHSSMKLGVHVGYFILLFLLKLVYLILATTSRSLNRRRRPSYLCRPLLSPTSHALAQSCCSTRVMTEMHVSALAEGLSLVRGNFCRVLPTIRDRGLFLFSGRDFIFRPRAWCVQTLRLPRGLAPPAGQLLRRPEPGLHSAASWDLLKWFITHWLS